MKNLRKIIIDVLIAVAFFATIFYLYDTYGQRVMVALFGESMQTIYIEETAVTVSIADTLLERQQGLSGVTELDPLQGKLFVFDEEGYYGMWMKDMLMPLDIIWINNDMTVVHVEKNLEPETYPTAFTSSEPARFVLEVNAFFADTFSVNIGDKVRMAPDNLPQDLQ